MTRSSALIRTSTPAGTLPGCPARLALTTRVLGTPSQFASSCSNSYHTTTETVCFFLPAARGSPSLMTSTSGSSLTWRRWGWSLASSPRVGATQTSGLRNTASSIALWKTSTGSITRTRLETTGWAHTLVRVGMWLLTDDRRTSSFVPSASVKSRKKKSAAAQSRALTGLFEGCHIFMQSVLDAA